MVYTRYKSRRTQQSEHIPPDRRSQQSENIPPARSRRTQQSENIPPAGGGGGVRKPPRHKKKNFERYYPRSSRNSTEVSLSAISVPTNRSRALTSATNNNRLATSHLSRNQKGIDYGGKHLANIHPPSSTMPVHPDVRFKHLPFYDLLAELMKPTSLVPKSNNRFQESFFVFHLTPQQAQDVAMSRDFRPGAKCEYTVQVQLRFCLLETSCQQADNFPPNICVRVNGKMAPLPNPIPTTKPGIEPKRPGRAIDITSLCRLSPTISNHLEVSWASEFGRGYCLAVFLVRRLTSDILLQRLKQFGNRHPDHTRALIKEKLMQDVDSEIATTSLRVSLMCPLGKMRLQIPCRASTCTHLQCYDASTFLMMNEKKSTWICPVCDKPATFDKLIIDGYFLEIFRASPDCSDIQFHPDGNWSPLEQPKETHVISSPVVKVSAKPAEASKAKSEPEVIDLTLESSDEEEEEEEVVAPKSVSDKGRQTSCSQFHPNNDCVIDLCTPELPVVERFQFPPTNMNTMRNVAAVAPILNTATTSAPDMIYPESLRVSPLKNSLTDPSLRDCTNANASITSSGSDLPDNTVLIPDLLEDADFFSIVNNETGHEVI